MRNAWNLVWKLAVICIVAGLSLGVTNELTKDTIKAQNIKKENEAFIAVMTPDAVNFEPIENPEGVDKAPARFVAFE
mgnify:CR=1 FL=1